MKHLHWLSAGLLALCLALTGCSRGYSSGGGSSSDTWGSHGSSGGSAGSSGGMGGGGHGY